MKTARRVGAVGLAVLVAATVALGQEGQSEPRWVFRDDARMFNPNGEAMARPILGALAKAGISAGIVTVESLDGRSLDEAAEIAARKELGEGVLIFLAEQDHKIEVYATGAYQGRMPRPTRIAVRDAMIPELKRGDNEKALREGLRIVYGALLPAPAAGAVAVASAPAEGEADLVLRNQVRLTLAGARKVIAAAEEKAAAMNLKVNIAVVDDGGHLMAFERMEGARPASGYTAMTKATTAATFRAATGPLPPGGSPDILLNLSLQNAASASGGKVTTLYGGVPIVVDGQVIGAVGVGGGTGEQDAEVARAGIDALLAGIGDAQE